MKKLKTKTEIWLQWRAAFFTHKANAKKQNIDFLLTFDTWYKIWKKSGKLNQRGPRRGQYVMARHNDSGNYEIGNVSIVTSDKNNKDRKSDMKHVFRVGEEHWHARLTNKNVVDIFYKNKIHREIAEEFKISRAQVSLIKTRRAWVHITKNLPSTQRIK